MVSGYSATTPGTQVITVTYGGFTTKFIVIVNEKPQEQTKEEIQEEPKVEEKEEQEVTKPNKVVVKPSISTTPSTDVDVEENTQETIEEIVPETKPNTNVQENTQEKPTATLGVKDEKQEENVQEEQTDKITAGVTLIGAMLILLLLILFKRNVKVYVEEDGEFVLGGLDKITKKHPELNIDKYLDGETYPNKVKIVLNDSISEKLDEKEIEIKHRGKVIKHKVNYQDKPYEIILE